MENPGNDNSNGYYMSTGDSTTQSNSYPFYVNLDSSEGLMLGQHVYIEADYGQDEERAGIWLDDYFIADMDGDQPYVWVDNGKGRLEKRDVILGQHDDEMMKSEIADGLTEEDLITYPEEGLEEGMPTARGDSGRMGQSNPQLSEEEMMEDGTMPADGEMLDDGTMPADGEILDDGTMPADGEMPDDGMTLEDGEMPAEGDGTSGSLTEDGTASAEAAGMGGGAVIIELRDICKDYIQDKMVIPVLKHVSFSMKEGEYVAVMGPFRIRENHADEYCGLSGSGHFRRICTGWTGYGEVFRQ